nr:MAG TPA: hypothetical protein [Caudoviricetes sp.]
MNSERPKNAERMQGKRVSLPVRHAKEKRT